MHPRTRTVVTVLFVLAFFVTTPLVIMSTTGYRYNWKRQRVQKTGSIQAETEPTGAKVSLDGVPQRKATPATFARLLPEDYLVRIEKKGYLPWEKTLEVQSGQTTFATGVILYRDTVPRLVLERRAASAAWSPDGTDVAFLADDEGWKELLAVMDGGEPALLARFARDQYADEALSWSPDGTALLFTADTDGATHVLRFAPATPGPAMAVHESFPKGRLLAHWNDDGTAVLVTNSLGAFSVDAAGALTPIRLETGIKDAAQRGRTSYVLRAEKRDGTASVAFARLSGDAATTLASLPSGDYRFVRGTDRRLLVADVRKRKMLAIDPSTGTVRSYDATGAEWEPDGRRLLLWNDFEIFTVDPADDERTLITRLGTPIGGCAWSPAGEAIIFSTSTGISAAELDERAGRNVFDLIKFTDVGPFAVDRAAKMLRFTGAAGTKNGIYERDL